MSSEERDKDSKFIIISRSTRDDCRVAEFPAFVPCRFFRGNRHTVLIRIYVCSRWLSVRRQIIVQRCIPRRVETSNSADSIVASLLVRPFLLVFLPRPREQRHKPLRRTGRYTRTAMPRKTPASIKKNRICMRATRTELRGRNIFEPLDALPLCR